LRHGNGSDFFSNGDSFVGQYYLGKPEGYGMYKWENGNTYTGHFKQGLKHGKGKWKKRPDSENKSAPTNNYEGDYYFDKKHGTGVFQWASGNEYKGSYEYDERQGYGEMMWTDGSIYKGMWNHGIQHGIGLMLFPDGIKKSGFFDRNIFREALQTIEEFDEDETSSRFPPEFRDQVLECLRQEQELAEEQQKQVAEIQEPYLDEEFKQADKEDYPQPNPYAEGQTQEMGAIAKTGQELTYPEAAIVSEAEQVQASQREASKKSKRDQSALTQRQPEQ